MKLNLDKFKEPHYHYGGVSEWMNTGKKYGYWDYFTKKALNQAGVKWAIMLSDKYFSICDTKEEAEDLKKTLHSPHTLSPGIEPIKATIKKIGIIEL